MPTPLRSAIAAAVLATAWPAIAGAAAPAQQSPQQAPQPPGTSVPGPPPPSGTPAPAPLGVIISPDQIDYVLATIRHLESNNTYDIPPNKARASGAYQFVPSTWAFYGGYPEAYQAPPWVQDERAAADVAQVLRQWSNDVSMVPIIWYYPIAARNPALLDQVPRPEFGNRLTIREYQGRWMQNFYRISGSGAPVERHFVEPPAVEQVVTIGPPQVPEVLDGPLAVAFPALGPVGVAPPPRCEGEGCVSAHDAVIYGSKLQPVLAAADGVVTGVRLGIGGGGVLVTITDTAGFRYEYTGLNDDTPGTDDGAAPEHLRVTALARIGATVRAGQVIGYIGDSALDNSDDEPPHVRLNIVGRDGELFDAYLSVTAALFRQTCTVGIGPWAVPPVDGLLTTPVDVTVGEGSGFTITATGEVTAVGRAALIYPTAGCQFAPTEPYGPGAGGEATVPLGWLEPIALPSVVWVESLPPPRIRTPVHG